MTETAKDFRYRDSIEEVKTLIQSRAPVIWVVTHEENRFLQEFYTQVASGDKKYKIYEWSIYRGLTDKTGKVCRKDNKDFFELLYLK